MWASEDPPGGGPAAALAAGVPHLTAPVVLVVAGDLVEGAAAVPALLAALGRNDAAVVWHGDRPQWLLAAWRRDALVAALSDLGDPVGARVRALYDGRALARVDDPGRAGGAQWSGDLDTPDDVRRLLGRPGPDDGLARGGG